MARNPRLQFENALHHVYCRGNRRERIAHTDRDYRILERYVIEAALKTGVIVRAWYPMPNHFHAVVETPRANLSQFMQTWLGRYARYYNRTYSKVGHVFQGRFGSKLVQREAYLKHLIRYVHLQRHLAKRPGAVDPSCDRYSSHRFYMGETCPPAVWAWIEPMLRLFGPTMESARKNYARFLADGLASGRWEEFYKPQGDYLGEEQFIASMKAAETQARTPRTVPQSQQPAFMQGLIQQAGVLFDIPVSEITSSSQRRAVCRARRAIAGISRQAGVTATFIAKALGKTQPAVSLMAQQAVSEGSQDMEALRRRLGN